MAVRAATAVSLALAAFAVAAPAAPAAAPPRCEQTSPAAEAVRARDQLRVRGNEVVDGAGHRYTPYGISVFGGLENGDPHAKWQHPIASAAAQIKAAARYWHANTVRLQVHEANLFNHPKRGLGYDPRFLAVLCDEVRLARRLRMVVVINDNTEFPDWLERNPTRRTERFWRIVGPIYRNAPGVIFDPFNEPRLFNKRTLARHSPMTSDLGWIWRSWRDGAVVAGHRFVGMRDLVDELRGMGARNIIWLDGPAFGGTLDLAGRYPIHAANLVWSIHHPPLGGLGQWDRLFGYLTANYPVVDGEWSQYAGTRPECRPNAYSIVPVYLRYLRDHDIGLLGWSLQEGALLATRHRRLPTNIVYDYEPTDPAAMRQPNRMRPDYACDNRHIGQGVGQWLMDYFALYGAR